MGEKYQQEAPCLIDLTTLNAKFNDSATPMLVHRDSKTCYTYTNDGVLAQLQINFDNVQSRQVDNQINAPN